MSDIILKLKNINRTYIDGDDPNQATVVEALKDINLDIRQ